MSKILLIDTNVLLRHILDDHPEHSQKAKVFMDKVKDGEITAKIIEGVLVDESVTQLLLDMALKYSNECITCPHALDEAKRNIETKRPQQSSGLKK